MSDQKKLLQITCSPNGEHSISNSICAKFVEAFKAKHPSATIVVRDLATHPVPHLDGEAIYAGYTPEESRSDSMKAKWAARLALIDELKSATDVVIATPMWNWNTPSVLKAYIDNIIIPGVCSPDMDPKPLAHIKFTFCVSQGGSYSVESGKGGWDFLTGYLVMVPKALGSTDIDLIFSEYGLAGIAPGMESLVEAKEKSIATAKEKAAERGSQ
jgi:FMN-dependent NADH-azoreductase